MESNSTIGQSYFKPKKTSTERESQMITELMERIAKLEQINSEIKSKTPDPVKRKNSRLQNEVLKTTGKTVGSQYQIDEVPQRKKSKPAIKTDLEEKEERIPL